MSQDFVHLRMHSEYSFRDSTIRLKQVVHKATAAGMKALACTDAGSIFGGVTFYKACLGQGLKPIIGVDAWIRNPSDAHHPSKLLLLCANAHGYHTLCNLLTKAWLENQVDEKGLIEEEWLTEENCEGLIAISGFHEGAIGRSLLNNKNFSAEEEAEKLHSIFKDRLYLELQRAGRKFDEELVTETIKLANKLKLPVVATHPIQFQEADGYLDHEIRCCIAQGTTLANPNRVKEYTEEQYFKTKEEMLELFKDIPSAIENTVEIAKRCNFMMKLGKPQLPLFETPDGISLDDYMAQLSREGLEMRLKILYPDEAKRDAERPRYVERLEREIGVIQKMGFSGYFLIVQDFIRWAKSHGCPVGPGRGSGAGSLVAFCLEITDLDPLEFSLLFERFLNPERVSMPDFDVDFCQNNRGRVIEYVKQKYGSDAVSQIATFGTMAAKGVIKDVGRVLDFPYNQCDLLTRHIPSNPGQQVSLEQAIESEPEFKAIISNSPELKPLVASAIKLEGLCRNIGIHAGGVLIAPGKLTDFCPLYAADMLPENVISMYDKKGVEEVGLVKFDFLGLTTLTIVARALDYIEKNTGKRPDIEHLQPTDKKVYDKIFKPADTAMVFQFESPGMRDIMVRSVPTKLSDLIALNALYRPGPMALADDFIELRKGGEKKPEYADDRLIPVLEETVGIMIYQEQVMQVAQIIAGYSLGGADILRRAMGKKDAAEMERQSKIFLEGAVKNGVKEEVAEELFNKMRKFAEYGFNKSHAAAYSYVAYQTAWLKCYYPAEFIAANLCEVMLNSTKLFDYIADAQRHGIKVLPVDINASEFYFTAPDSKTIRFGMGALKGMGEGPANAIVEERTKNGPFKDMEDLVSRLGTKVMSRKVLEVLSTIGAFDSIDPNRRMWLENVPQIYRSAQENEENADQMGLFGEESSEMSTELVQYKPWDTLERMKKEKSIIGFFFTGSPMDACREEIKDHFGGLTIKECPLDTQTKFSNFKGFGVVSSINFGVSKTGNHFCKLNIDDGLHRYEMRTSQELYEFCKKEVSVDEVYMVEGTVVYNDQSNVFSWNLKSMRPISEIRASHGAKLQLVLDKKGKMSELKALIEELSVHPSSLRTTPIEIKVREGDTEVCIPLPANFSALLSGANLSKVENSDLIKQAKINYK